MPICFHLTSEPRLFEARARACERIDDKDEAMSAGGVVLAHRRSAGDPTQLAVWLTWLGDIGMNVGNPADARKAVLEADRASET